MKIVVLGAGVIGVTSAWELSRAGHEVTVVDRQPAAAMETSFANAGEISPGYSTPWAAPGIPQKALRWMFQRHAPLVLHASADPRRASWMAKMLRNSSRKASSSGLNFSCMGSSLLLSRVSVPRAVWSNWGPLPCAPRLGKPNRATND